MIWWIGVYVDGQMAYCSLLVRPCSAALELKYRPQEEGDVQAVAAVHLLYSWVAPLLLLV